MRRIEQLDAIEAAVEEQEQTAEADVVLECRLDERVKTMEAFSQVDAFAYRKKLWPG